MDNDREKKRARLTEEEEPERDEIEEPERVKEGKAARKAKKKVKRTKKAMSKVLGIPELREMIILHLPLRQLLLARSVSRSFAASIDTVKVRRALWLEPSSNERLRWMDHPDSMVAHQMERENNDTGSWVNLGDVSTEKCHSIIVNPFMPVDGEFGFLTQESMVRGGLLVYDLRPTEYYWYSDVPIEDVHKEFLERCGSLYGSDNYASMQFAHPPVQSVEASESNDCDVKVKDEDGVKIGPLFDALTISADSFSCINEMTWQQRKRDRAQQNVDVLKDRLKDIKAGRAFPNDYEKRYPDPDFRDQRQYAYWDGPGYDLQFNGSEKWQALERGVDEITGWEMLAIFEAGSEKAVYGDKAARPPAQSNSPKALRQAERRILSEEMVVDSDEE
ncbi:hypothetical protein LTS10_012100 [Elasticomyces elasticus]|nr:hypothetical protein LTS10_012100 [Elasticomyces elasticus]